jgi:hypothetical protein
VLVNTESTSLDCGDDMQVAGSSYTKRFDAARVHHVLENLLSLARFGGQGFTRIAKTCPVSQTHDPHLRALLQTGA